MTVLYAPHGLRKLDRHGAELVRKKFLEEQHEWPPQLKECKEGFPEEKSGKRSNWILGRP